jgi:hypothetical protein
MSIWIIGNLLERHWLPHICFTFTGVTVHGHGQMLGSFMFHNHGMKETSLSYEIASEEWAN